MKESKLQQHFANQSISDGYTGESNSPRQKMVLECLSRFALRRKMLDIGPGTGAFLAPLASRHDLSAIDVSELCLDRCLSKGYSSVHRLDAFSETFPFEDGTFQAVVCAECIEHGADTDWLLSEINRVLKYHGDLVLTFPNIRTPIGLAMMLMNHPPMFAARYRSGHVRDFTTRSIEAALRNHNFRIISMQGSHFCFSSNPVGRFTWLAKRYPSWASCVVVHAIKNADSAYEIASHL